MRAADDRSLMEIEICGMPAVGLRLNSRPRRVRSCRRSLRQWVCRVDLLLERERRYQGLRWPDGRHGLNGLLPGDSRDAAPQHEHDRADDWPPADVNDQSARPTPL